MASKADAKAIIDIGKTRCKVNVIEASGKLLFERSTATQSDGHLIDIDLIWQWLVETLQLVSTRFNVVALFPVAHGATAALGAAENLTWYVLDYEAEYLSVDDQYETHRGSFAETHSPNLERGLNLARQLFWLRQSAPHKWAAIEQILLYPQYWAWCLCGVAASEVSSLGCHTDLWNPTLGQFSQLAKELSVDQKLPAMRKAWDVLGCITDEVAAATGLPLACKVYCGSHDSNASYAAYLSRPEPAFSVVSTGTWVVCMGKGSDPTLDAKKDTLSNVDVTGRPVPCARFVGGREYGVICGSSDASAGVADALTLINNGTFAEPSFTTLGGPFSAKGGVIPEALTKEQRAALASLYCALMTDYCLDLIEARGPLFVEGRFCEDEIYMRALAGLRPGGVLRGNANGSCSGARVLMRWPQATRIESVVIDQSLFGISEYRDTWRAKLLVLAH